MADVVICGGGLAGLTLARQLKLKFPSMDLVVICKDPFPIPSANSKVGESTVEMGAFYLQDTLGLKDYLKNNHFAKLGLRFFFNGGEKEFEKRPELGLSSFPPYDSYQIDRAILENDLYQFIKADGVKVYDEAAVKDIHLSNEGKHQVEFQFNGEVSKLECDWVVDASGRRSLIQKKYDLRKKVGSNCSAAWFRVKGRVAVGDFVDASNKKWHNRVKDKIRYFSTNHLMGKGYWIWIIPLSSGNTSIGLVTNDEYHNYVDYAGQEKLVQWMLEHEPELGKNVQSREFVDFRAIKSYAYSTKQLFSTNKWACVGDAALFPDPFYSPGINIIGFENTMITKMIELDYENKLDDHIVKKFNDYIIAYNEWLIETIHSAYSHFGNDQVMSLNYLWDLVVGWCITTPQMFNHVVVEEEKFEALRAFTVKFSLISGVMRDLFKEWELMSKGSFTFDFIDYLSVPFIKEVYDRNIKSGKSADELISDFKINIELLEEFAQSIFLLAVEDVYPEYISDLREKGKLDPLTFSLQNINKVKMVDKGRLIHSIDIQIRNLFSFHTKGNTTASSVDASFDFDFNEVH